MKVLSCLVAISLGLAHFAQSDESPRPDAAASQTGQPTPVTPADFRELVGNSPFTRALNLSDSLTLTGIATIGSDTIATVVDKTSKQTYVVSARANAQGWRMLGVDGDQNDLERVTARIAVAGGEVVTVRFDDDQLNPSESRPAAGTVNAEGRDGERGRERGRRGPPEEIREKMRQLSEDQRGKLFGYLREYREKNPDASRDDMREAFRKTLEKMTGDR